jgi:hypothetical protein
MIEAQFMKAEDRLVQKLNRFRQEFKYKYVGGGRDATRTAVLARARSVICSSIAPLNVAGCNIHMSTL